MYFFLPSSFFMLLLLYLLKQRSYSIIYEALLCVIFFFVHTDVGQILKIICLWYQSVIIYAEHVNKHKSTVKPRLFEVPGTAGILSNNW